MKTILGLVVCFISTSSALLWPLPGIELCHRSHPDFQECLAKNIPIGARILKDGIKEIGFPQIDPLKLPSPTILKVSGNKNLELSLTYINSYMKEITDGITIPRIDPHIGDHDDHCSWAMDMLIPRTVIYGDYSVQGKLLMFDINGHGKFNVTIHNYICKLLAECEKIQKKGKTYIKLTNVSVEMNPKAAEYYFENLVPGNPEISDQVLKAINDESLLIWDEMKSGLNAIVSKIHLDVENKFFTKIPRDEIFLP